MAIINMLIYMIKEKKIILMDNCLINWYYCVSRKVSRNIMFSQKNKFTIMNMN